MDKASIDLTQTRGPPFVHLISTEKGWFSLEGVEYRAVESTQIKEEDKNEKILGRIRPVLIGIMMGLGFLLSFCMLSHQVIRVNDLFNYHLQHPTWPELGEISTFCISHKHENFMDAPIDYLDEHYKLTEIFSSVINEWKKKKIADSNKPLRKSIHPNEIKTTTIQLLINNKHNNITELKTVTI